MEEKRNIQLGYNQQFVAQPQSLITQPMIGQPQASTSQAQPVIIQIRKPSAKRYTKYQTVKSRTLGIIMIVCGVVAVILNAVGIGIHDRADRQVRDYSYRNRDRSGSGQYYWRDSTGFYISAAFWCSPLFFVCGAFAIFASKRPTKCPLVTCLVLSIISMVFSGVVVSMATWTVAEDAERLEAGFTYTWQPYGFRNNTYREPNPPSITKINHKAEGYAKGCVVISFLYMCVSIIELVACILLCVINSKVLCAEDSQDDTGGATEVQYITNQQTGAQPQILILDRHGQPITDAQVVQMPGPGIQTGIVGQTTGVIPQGQSVAPAATTGHLASDVEVAPTGQLINVQPPSYTVGAGGNQPTSQTGEDSPPPAYN